MGKGRRRKKEVSKENNKMKVYFLKTNVNNLVVITNGETAKIYDAAPTGIYEGVDLYTENAAYMLAAAFQRLEERGELNGFYEIGSSNEVSFRDIENELENAEIVFEN